MIRLAQQLLTQSETLEYLDRPALHPVCLAHSHGSCSALEDLAGDPGPGEPGCGTEAGAAGAGD